MIYKNPCKKCIVRSTCNYRCDKMEEYCEKISNLISKGIFITFLLFIYSICILVFTFHKGMGIGFLGTILTLNMCVLTMISTVERLMTAKYFIWLLFSGFSVFLTYVILGVYDVDKKIIYYKMKDLEERHGVL